MPSQPPEITLGRVVHYRIGAGEDETLRSAIVTEVHSDGGVALHVFAKPEDVPFAHGSAVRADSIIGYYVDRAYEGEALGSWRWPPRV